MLILNSNLIDTKNILVIVNGLPKLDNAYLIFRENKDCTFYVIFNGKFCIQEYYNSRLSKLPNLIINEKAETELFVKIEKFGLVITTECAAAPSCLPGLIILALCAELHIPIVELQHGLFQYGLHYTVEDESYKKIYDFLNVDNFTDYLLSFYPVNTEYRKGTVIGFPKYHLCDLQPYNNYDAGYVLILTNFNWDCFSPEDFDNFLGCLLKTTEAHREIQFVWKPHPSEIGLYLNKNQINLDAFNNITIVSDDPMLNLTPLDSLVKYASKIISTLSTVLFDCEAYGKDTAVFKCGANSQLLSEIDSCYTFSNESQLRAFIESKQRFQITTGKLIEYDNSEFRKLIDEHYSLCRLPKKEVLKSVVKYRTLFEKIKK